MLAAAITRLGGADLIIAATESSDGYTGTVPEQLAEVLGSSLGDVRQARRGRGWHPEGESSDGGGLRRGHLPVARRHQRDRRRRRASLSELQRHHGGKVKPVETVTAADLGVTPVGWAGAGQKIADVTKAEARKAGEIIEDDGEGYAKIVAFLENLKVI